MASILLLDSSVASAAPTVAALTAAGHAVRDVREAADLLSADVPGSCVLIVRDHLTKAVDPGGIRRLVAALKASGLVVLAPPSRWVAWVAVADRVLPHGASAALLSDAIARLGNSPRRHVRSVATSPRPPAKPEGAADPPVDVPTIGIDGYRIVRLQGRGGMSVVYVAEHAASGETRVLKLLPISEHDGGVLVQRLINEAALLSQLQHPGIVRIHEHGFTEWHAYIAMEYLPGGDLSTLLGRALPPALAVEILLQIAEALGAIHRAGMVHRDLKPANVLRRADGTCVLADFGIARMRGVDLSLSRPGNLIGTANYLAPETITSGRVDHLSDVYALGVLFHEMLTGRRPFEAGDPVRVMELHRTAPVPQLPSTLRWAQPLLDRLLAKLPEDRFDSADTLISAVVRTVAEQQHAAAGSTAVRGAIPPRSHADAG